MRDAARALEDEWRLTVPRSHPGLWPGLCYAFRRQVQRHSVQVLERSVDVTRILQKAGAATAMDHGAHNGLREKTRACALPM